MPVSAASFWAWRLPVVAESTNARAEVAKSGMDFIENSPKSFV
jgi:hypothetical protein